MRRRENQSEEYILKIQRLKMDSYYFSKSDIPLL